MSTGELRTCLQSTLLLRCGVSLREGGAALCCYGVACHCVKEVLSEYLHMKLSFVSVGKHESLRRKNTF